jgi:tetratricopeptide (TPR) repeat protein
LTRLIQESPLNTGYYQHRAERYRKLGEYRNATEDYQRWIELTPGGGKAWPLRDLAQLYIEGPTSFRNYETALALLRQALDLEADNPDNHFRYGVACYRLGRYEEAAPHLDAARRHWEKNGDKLAAALFYQAMCSALVAQRVAASQFLDQARQAYARTDLTSRASQSGALSDLFWEAERVVSRHDLGG